MPSVSWHRWATTRRAALDEIAQAHVAVGGMGRGRRYATQQINQAYAVLLASQFQGFCRDLHTECIDRLVPAVPALLRPILRAELTQRRQLDEKNAQPGSIGADFNRLGLRFWDAVTLLNARNLNYQNGLEQLNAWRNAIAHHNFDPTKLGGTTTLRLSRVRRWRLACSRLALAFDKVMRRHLQTVTGTLPW
jgi:hypothetical protein